MDKSTRLHSLDFLKFLLAIVIIFHHFQQVTKVQFSGINFCYGPIYFGYIVECFFIISGFVTALRLDIKPIENFQNWMVGKSIRIYPMTIFSVIITLLIYIFYKILLGELPEGISIGLWQILNSITLTFVGGGVGNIEVGINNPIWYLCILLVCYIFVYILNWLSKKLKIHVNYFYFALMVVGLSVVTYELNLPFLNNKVGRGYTAFFFGMLFYQIFKYISKKYLVTYSIVCLVSCVIAVVFQSGIDNQWAIFTFMIWPSVIIIAILFEPILKWKGFEVLGATSFEMYLWHSAAIWIFVIIKTMVQNQNYTFIEMISFTVVTIVFSFAMLAIEKKVTTFLKSKLILKENK